MLLQELKSLEAHLEEVQERQRGLIPGIPGQKGDKGLNVFSPLLSSFHWTFSRFALSRLLGERGLDGIPGKMGIIGLPGIKGEKGHLGSVGLKGERGNQVLNKEFKQTANRRQRFILVTPFITWNLRGTLDCKAK